MMGAHARNDASSTSGWSATALAGLAAVAAGEECRTVRQEPLGRHTSMGVGGPTPLMVWPGHPEAVAKVLEWCAERHLAWRILGAGTNVLVSDAGVTEPVINLTNLIEGAKIEAPTALFPAGVPTAQAVRTSTRAGLGGLVWSTGLPGTIGGAAAGNAGCWGGEMADVVARLDVVDGAGTWHGVDAEALTWSYRGLRLPESVVAGAVIVSVALKLRPEDASELTGRCDELQQLKRLNQPVGARNAGCIFKNPDAERAAGWLIDQAGCKGTAVGAAQISELHGNFLINLGGATAADVDALIAQVTKAVREQSGIALEEEIRRW